MSLKLPRRLEALDSGLMTAHLAALTQEVVMELDAKTAAEKLKLHELGRAQDLDHLTDYGRVQVLDLDPTRAIFKAPTIDSALVGADQYLDWLKLVAINIEYMPVYYDIDTTEEFTTFAAHLVNDLLHMWFVFIAITHCRTGYVDMLESQWEKVIRSNRRVLGLLANHYSLLRSVNGGGNIAKYRSLVAPRYAKNHPTWMDGRLEQGYRTKV